MAFFSMFLVWIIIILAIVCGSTVLAVILLIVSAVLKKRQNVIKRNAEMAGDFNYQIKKTYLAVRIVGFVFVLPITLLVGVFLWAAVDSAIVHHTSLSYNVFNGNITQTEKILKSGADPDCTVEEHNARAQLGEETLLYALANGENGSGSYSGEIDDHEKRLQMMQLLIDYGADVNSVCYTESKNAPEHTVQDEYSYFNVSDRCGSTPLMAATYRADFDMIKLLVKNGADVNAVDYCGFNVINIVADSLSDSSGYEILQYYLDQGVDPNNITNFEQSSYFLADRSNSSENQKIVSELEKLMIKENYNGNNR